MVLIFVFLIINDERLFIYFMAMWMFFLQSTCLFKPIAYFYIGWSFFFFSLTYKSFYMFWIWVFHWVFALQIPVCCLSFHFLTGVFWWTRILLNVVKFIHHFTYGYCCVFLNFFFFCLPQDHEDTISPPLPPESLFYSLLPTLAATIHLELIVLYDVRSRFKVCFSLPADFQLLRGNLVASPFFPHQTETSPL